MVARCVNKPTLTDNLLGLIIAISEAEHTHGSFGRRTKKGQKRAFAGKDSERESEGGGGLSRFDASRALCVHCMAMETQQHIQILLNLVDSCSSYFGVYEGSLPTETAWTPFASLQFLRISAVLPRES